MIKQKTIGFSITGSFCTFREILKVLEELSTYNTIVPIFSYNTFQTDTRFFQKEQFYREVEIICGRKPITTIADAEPIGPEKQLDIMIIAPCTGNSLAKLAYSITDTPVLMAAKAHLRNNRPLLLAVSTNDALAGTAKNIGVLLNYKNIYFVPHSQDDPIKKPRSIVADYSLVGEAAQAALDGRQLNPIFL